jgi:hypothetical protein
VQVLTGQTLADAKDEKGANAKDEKGADAKAEVRLCVCVRVCDWSLALAWLIPVCVGVLCCVCGKAVRRDYQTSAGVKLEGVDLVIQATGATTNSECLTRGFGAVLDARKRIKVRPTLQVEGAANVFALGDVASLPEESLAL